MVKSPHAKVALGWTVAVFTGLYGFYLSRQHIISHRYEAMKARERISKVTETHETNRKIGDN